VIDFWQRHWLATLVLLIGVLALPTHGPTFSANDHAWTMPGWLFGAALIVAAAMYLVTHWRKEER
jgi:hypothetical protein